MENHEDYWIEKAKIDFAVAVNQKMRANRINRSSFAELLKTSASYVTKLLGGDANLSIASMVKTARALGCDLAISIRPRNATTSIWVVQAKKQNVIHGVAGTAKIAANDGGVHWERATAIRLVK